MLLCIPLSKQNAFALGTLRLGHPDISKSPTDCTNHLGTIPKPSEKDCYPIPLAMRAVHSAQWGRRVPPLDMVRVNSEILHPFCNRAETGEVTNF